MRQEEEVKRAVKARENERRNMKENVGDRLEEMRSREIRQKKEGKKRRKNNAII